MRRVVSVGNREWMSQFDAADVLDVGVFRIGALIGNGHLVPAENESSEAGVTLTSGGPGANVALISVIPWRVIRVVRDAVNYL